MTDKRTTIVLSVIAGALLVFILAFERGSLSTADVARRTGHVLPRFVRDRVTRVELVRGDEAPVVFERQPAQEEGELGLWRIVGPVQADADQDAVDSLLGALEWLMPERTLTGIGDADRERFGLSSPRFVVRFQVADEQVALRLGGESTQPEGVYVAVEGDDRAFVVGSDFRESLDHDLAHFRDKDVFPEDFFSADARQVALSGDDQTLRFEKEGTLWQLREPVRGYANVGAVDRMLRLTRELRAQRFVAEDASELGRYGLDHPWRELTVTRPEDAQGTRVARLRVGDACGEHAQERYALIGDAGPVVCVLASAVSALELSGEDARERRLLALAPDAVERVVVAGQGARLELTRQESGWGLTVGAEGSASITADTSAVDEWLRALRDARAQVFEPVGDAPGHGIDTPTSTLTFTPAEGGDAVVVRLGEGAPDGAWARRGDEAALARFDVAVAALLTPDALRFRNRDVVGRVPGDARRVVLRRGEAEERATRGEGGDWQLEAPLETEADRVVVREVARQVAELRASRFVATQAAPEHGLEAPRLVVEVQFQPEGEDPATATVRIGAPTEEGAYAQVEGQTAVFEVASSVVEALDVALVSRDLLSVDLSSVTSIRIERDGEQVADLRRDGPRWLTADGASAHGERTRDLLERLVGLRAEGVVTYGAGDAAGLGLEPPATRVTLGRSAGNLTVDIGEDQDGFAPVRGSAVGVVYRFRPDLVRVFRTYTP